MPAGARALVSGEEAVVEAFLAQRAESTVFLRSNLARVGLTPRDAAVAFTGTWMGAFEGGRLAGVATLFWNDNLVLAAGPHAGFLARTLADAHGGASPSGILGRWNEVEDARHALGMDERATRLVSKEILYDLDLADLVLPEPLRNGALAVRSPHERELDALLEWRMVYELETAGVSDTPESRGAARDRLARYQREGHHFVCSTRDGTNVAYSAFNATLTDLVQIGGVYTPSEVRSKGYARCAVAGSLAIARARGVVRSILFTGEENPAAQRAYAAIGFRPVGDYGIVLFVAAST